MVGIVLLAELEVFHSRPIAPTRRVALGQLQLPVDPSPGHGGVLLGGVVARFSNDMDPDLYPDIFALSRELEAGMRIPQPRLRHRFQQDIVGLGSSVQQLVQVDGEMSYIFESDKGAPEQFVLAAIYAAGELDGGIRASVMETIRQGLRWSGPVGPSLIFHLLGGSASAVGSLSMGTGDPVSWALSVLGFGGADETPEKKIILTRFRDLLRDAHPDHGGGENDAADRITELTEARRILLAS